MGLVNHWAPERHSEWETQESAYSLAILVSEPAVRKKVGELQPSLDLTYLDRVPVTELQILVAGLGDTAATSREQAVVFGREVASSIKAPFELSMGVAAVFGESVISFADPVEDIARLQDRAVAAVEKYRRVTLAVPTFPPHMTLAWSNIDGPSADLAAALTAFPADGLGAMVASELCLLEVFREVRHYRYDVLERFPFTSAGSGRRGSGDGSGEGKKSLWKKLFR